MKKVVLFIFLIFLLAGCSKKESKNADISEVMDNIKSAVKLDKSKQEDITSLETAERYGLSPDDIEEGSVYYTSDENKSDKIILIKAKNKDAVENIEKALAAEIVGLNETWGSNDKEARKVENHLLKTRDDYIILAVSDDVEKIENIFDEKI